MIVLTARQTETLAFIRERVTAQGYPPSRREIADHLGVTYNAANGHVLVLLRKGVLALDRGRGRGLRVLTPLEPPPRPMPPRPPPVCVAIVDDRLAERGIEPGDWAVAELDAAGDLVVVEEQGTRAVVPYAPEIADLVVGSVVGRFRPILPGEERDGAATGCASAERAA